VFEHVDEECICEGRYCSGCDQTKCHRAFSKDAKGAFGLSSRCKNCIRDYQKSHIDQINAQRRKNRREKADHYSTYNKEYHRKNPEPKKARDRKYRQEHLEKIKAHDRVYRRNYKRTNERYRKYAAEYNRRYWQLHPEKLVPYWSNCRSRKLRAEGVFTASEWKNLCTYYEYTCLCCRRCEPEIKLTVDHVVPLSKGGTNFIGNIQPLCQSCNSSKRAKIIDYRINWRRG
jgi:5-methylcytosine-specific restriction endonuclease McrA